MPRLSPQTSATAVPKGIIMLGNDRRPWVAITTKNGVQRLTPYVSVKLNGLRVLSLDYLAENVGKPIKIYDRSASNVWPSGVRDDDLEPWTFIPSGDATLSTRKTPYLDWLFTRSPSPPSKGNLMIDGIRSRSSESDIDYRWGPIVTGGVVATSNPRNTQSFVRA